MTRRLFLLRGFAALESSNGRAFSEGSFARGKPFVPAVYSTLYEPAREGITTFPFNGKPTVIVVPRALQNVTVSLDGKKLYGQPDTRSSSAGIYEIDLSLQASTLLQGTSSLYRCDISASSDANILFLNVWRSSGQNKKGWFKLDVLTGSMQPLLSNPNVLEGWNNVAVSADGGRAVADRDGRFALIDLISGRILVSLKPFASGVWSPDGKWLAVDTNNDRFAIFASEGLRLVRVLSGSKGSWSPDSERLLFWKWHLFCSPYWGSLFTVEPDTGHESIVRSSRCRVSSGKLLWVSGDLNRQ